MVDDPRRAVWIDVLANCPRSIAIYKYPVVRGQQQTLVLSSGSNNAKLSLPPPHTLVKAGSEEGHRVTTFMAGSSMIVVVDLVNT